MTARLIAVCGGRDYSDRARIRKELARYLPASVAIDLTVIHGDSRGADRLAAQEAAAHGFRVESVPADWERYGRGAGPIRNRQILDRSPGLVIAFPGGKGTADMVAESKRRGISVREIA